MISVSSSVTLTSLRENHVEPNLDRQSVCHNFTANNASTSIPDKVLEEYLSDSRHMTGSEKRRTSHMNAVILLKVSDSNNNKQTNKEI